jgi:single-stranded-DNA-specific exonuclease
MEIQSANFSFLREHDPQEEKALIPSPSPKKREKSKREGWHHGVIGIVASRLVERYGAPVFIGS